MQGGRSRSPLRGLIDATSFGINASMSLSNNSGSSSHRERHESSKKHNSSLSASASGSSLNYQYDTMNQNQGQNLVAGYSAYNLAMGGTTTPQVTVLKRNAQEAGLMNNSADESSESDDEVSAKPALKPGKKTKGRVKIKMEFIQNKLRRYTTFSKRKTGIMKKAYELSTLTGTQVMLLVASETGHVYTFATRKLQPMITSDSGKALIQTCLNSPDMSGSLNDQRMNPTGYEETELNYAVSEEEMKQSMEPGMDRIRNSSPPSEPEDDRRPIHAPARARVPAEYRGAVPKENRHLLHPRHLTQPRQMAPSTSGATSNGANHTVQVTSAGLQLGVEGVRTDAMGNPYVTIPLSLSNQQLIQMSTQHAGRLPGQTTTLSAQNLAGIALDASKRHDKK